MLLQQGTLFLIGRKKALHLILINNTKRQLLATTTVALFHLE